MTFKFAAPWDKGPWQTDTPEIWRGRLVQALHSGGYFMTGEYLCSPSPLYMQAMARVMPASKAKRRFAYTFNLFGIAADIVHSEWVVAGGKNSRQLRWSYDPLCTRYMPDRLQDLYGIDTLGRLPKPVIVDGYAYECLADMHHLPQLTIATTIEMQFDVDLNT